MDDDGLIKLTQAAGGQLGQGGRQRLAAKPSQLECSPMQGGRQIDGGSHACIIRASVVMHTRELLLLGARRTEVYSLDEPLTSSDPSLVTWTARR